MIFLFGTMFAFVVGATLEPTGEAVRAGRNSRLHASESATHVAWNVAVVWWRLRDASKGVAEYEETTYEDKALNETGRNCIARSAGCVVRRRGRAGSAVRDQLTRHRLFH